MIYIAPKSTQTESGHVIQLLLDAKDSAVVYRHNVITFHHSLAPGPGSFTGVDGATLSSAAFSIIALEF